MWHFCGKQNNDKIEKIQERALRILHNDYVTDYPVLLSYTGKISMLKSRLHVMILEVYKSLHGLNPVCIRDMFENKNTNYSFRDPSKIIQIKRNTTTYGLRSFTYFGSKLWNELPIDFKELIDITDFKEQLRHWDGPDIEGAITFYV